MPIGPGSRFGPYEVTALIGQGGMGQVWRAHHVGLKRDDALKVLPDAFASDPGRLARFQREAQVLASLNHPNIAHVYGLEHTEGVQALVMELVEGTTLADRIAQGPIPVDEALPIARQIAEALEGAHDQGIIHRDLKPANIKLRQDGTVKVLDFGLAKALDSLPAVGVDATASPTITSPAMMTGQGILLGTAAYMSPEQARGKFVDQRTDIWAFGCVLYEMLTGQRAFAGEDVTDTLAAVVRGEPSWDALPSAVSPTVRMVLRRCLHKDVRQRVADIRDVRLAIDGAFETPVAERRESTMSAPLVPRWRRAIVHAALFVLGGAIVGGAVWSLTRPESGRVLRMQLVRESSALRMQGFRPDITITPDGTRVVYRGDGQLFVRDLDQLESRVLARLGDPNDPFVSPDGQWVGFAQSNVLKKVSITGGPVVTIGEIDGLTRGASWADNGDIVFATNLPDTGLQRVSSDGGQPVVLTTPDQADETDHLWPEWLPGNQAVLFTIWPVDGILDLAQIAVFDLRTHTRTILVRGGYNAHYVASGHLVYGAGGGLRAVAFDLPTLSVRGSPVPVVDQVVTTGTGAVNAAVAKNGTLTYVAGSAYSVSHLVWLDRAGRVEGSLANLVTNLRSLALAPDESRVVHQSGTGALGAVWITDLQRNVTARVTSGTDPLWSPDGGRLAIAANVVTGGSGQVLALPVAGGEPQVLFESKLGQQVWTEDWHPGGDRLAILLVDGGIDRGAVISTQSEATVIFDEASQLDEPHFSPDGKWIVYNANRDGGGMEVYLVPFPPTGQRVQVSSNGGGQARWRGDGRELFYLTPTGTMMAVDVDIRSGLRLGVPRVLFESGIGNLNLTLDQYAVTRDGQRFLVSRPAETPDGTNAATMVVVTNWHEELKRRVPAN